MSRSLSSASCPAQLVVGSMCPRVHLSLSAPASSRFPSYPVSFPFGKLVGSSGLEPPTSRLSGVRSNHLSYEPIFRGRLPMASPFRPLLRFFFLRAAGGDEQIRTVDPLLARQVLSQLSYTPVFSAAALQPANLSALAACFSPPIEVSSADKKGRLRPFLPPLGPSKLNNVSKADVSIFPNSVAPVPTIP